MEGLVATCTIWFELIPFFIFWMFVGMLVMYIGYTVVRGFHIYATRVIDNGAASFGHAVGLLLALVTAPVWVPILFCIEHVTHDHTHLA